MLYEVITVFMMASGSFVSSILFRDKMEHIVMWTMGSFSSASWNKVAIGVPAMLVPSILCLLFARDLNIMLQGDEARITSYNVCYTKLLRNTYAIC